MLLRNVKEIAANATTAGKVIHNNSKIQDGKGKCKRMLIAK